MRFWIQLIFCSLLALLVSGYAWLTYVGWAETPDAQALEAAQVTVQQTVSKAIRDFGLSPMAIPSRTVALAAKSQLPQGVVIDDALGLHLEQSPRGAALAINPNGDVTVIQLQNFTRYHVVNGRIRKTGLFLGP